jgi:peptidoglycan/xylan/chitin deacetylase (PgdA/CDA1 family)
VSGEGRAAAPLPASSAPLGLRVDVDTHEGMRDGVPRLLELFAAAGVRATFYLSMGPDRSGLAVLNALRPGFLAKMSRTGAASVYGWRTILSGTLLPARPIATAFPEVARRVRDEGHEVGVHAWEHRRWQDRLLRWPEATVARVLDRGREAFRAIFASEPRTYAAPAWLSNDAALLHEEAYGLDFASDCRGTEPFLPVVAGRTLATPQVPTTLPTLDEALGDTHADAASYFAEMLDLAAAGRWHSLTVHAELEGGPYAGAFASFLADAAVRRVRCTTLGALLEERRAAGPLSACRLEHLPVRGRHGVVATQVAGG